MVRLIYFSTIIGLQVAILVFSWWPANNGINEGLHPTHMLLRHQRPLTTQNGKGEDMRYQKLVL